MKSIIQSFAAILFLSYPLLSFAGKENTFYILHSKDPAELSIYLDTVKRNYRSIHILISQAYKIDGEGNLSGYLNQELVDLAKKHSIKLMAMITNGSFDQLKAHQFLSSAEAQKNAINSIIDICKKYHLYGVQFDFENISVDDKNELTKFYKKAAGELHQHGYKVSFAIIPAFPEQMKDSSFLKKTWQNWSGAYDLKSLGEYSDFVTVMAYNQHPDGTIPGPNASIGFTSESVNNALKEIPASKLSLGIPAYSLYWYSGHHSIPVRQAEISYKHAISIIKKNNSSITWSQKDKVNFSRYEHNWLNEYVYLEDKHSFKAKQDLVKKFGLRGISVFRIGTEDSGIWEKI